MRVLHLIDAASPQARPTTLAMLRAATLTDGADHEVLLAGGQQLAKWAREAGLKDPPRLTAPYGRAVLALPALAGRLRGRSFDAVHCWSVGAAVAARFLLPRTPRVLSLTVPPDPQSSDALKWLLRWPGAPTRVTILNAEILRGMGQAVPAGLVDQLEPPAWPVNASAPAREAIRRGWGLAGREIRVVALLSDPPEAGDALAACLALGLAMEAAATNGERPDVHLLVHPDQQRRLQAQRMMINYRLTHVMLQDAGLHTPWQRLPGCDAAVVLGSHTGGLAVRCAMAAGIPIIAEDHPAGCELLVPEKTALTAETGQSKRLAHRLHQLFRDPSEAIQLAANARAMITNRRAAFSEQISDIYARLLANPPSLTAAAGANGARLDAQPAQ